MKRSRGVVLTMMGSAAAGAVSMGWVGAPNCGRNETLVPGDNGGRPYCRARAYGGFGVTSQRIHAHVVHHGHGGYVHHGGGGFRGGGGFHGGGG